MIVIKMVQTFVLKTCGMIGIRQINGDSVFVQLSTMIQNTIYVIT